MGRIRSLASLNKAVEYATARQAYYSTPRPGKTTVEPNPKDTYIYSCGTYIVAGTPVSLKLQACVQSVEKFGIDVLGLKAGDDPSGATAGRIPRGFRPAKVKGSIGADTPTVGTSPVSGRRVIKYTASSTGNAKANFTAPVSGISDAAQRTAFAAVVAANSAEFKTEGYGRLWFEPEYLPMSG